MAKLIYCATPSRFSEKTDEIMDFVTDKGLAPLHPFQAYPFERFEGNPKIGRDLSLKWCLRLIDISDEFWIFGISEGTVIELEYALSKGMEIKYFIKDFDNEYLDYLSLLKNKLPDLEI